MFWGLSSIEWTALAAIGTLALAIATVAAVWVTVRLAAAERRRDDTKRREDRERDDQLRTEQRERDDRLRQEVAGELERRERAERRAREDYEARQVTVMTGESKVVVSSPLEYPIKQVWMALVSADSGNFSVYGENQFATDPWIPRKPEDPDTPKGRVYYSFPVDFDRGEKPIIRFTDWHGNRYYQYRNYTERFGQNTEFLEAAMKIDEWIRTGPNPD